MKKTLLIDNYDSYTYNLFQLITEVNGEEPVVVRCDAPGEIPDLTKYDNEPFPTWCAGTAVAPSGVTRPLANGFSTETRLGTTGPRRRAVVRQKGAY